jgi:hypothetical protein
MEGMLTCPACGAEIARETWSLGRRLRAQIGTIAAVIVSGFGTLIAQADTLPHPYDHVVIVICLLAAIVAAIRIKT